MKKYLNLSWDYHASDIPKSIQTWVLYKQSFMQRLTQHGIHDARIHVLKENWELPEASEKKLLKLDLKQPAFVREVLILNDQYQLMFARAVMPESLSKGPLKELFHLGNRPLGSVLFHYLDMHRSDFNFALLCEGMEKYDELNGLLNINHDNIYARRSLFTWHEDAILLSEFFLPDITRL